MSKGISVEKRRQFIKDNNYYMPVKVRTFQKMVNRDWKQWKCGYGDEQQKLFGQKGSQIKQRQKKQMKEDH